MLDRHPAAWQGLKAFTDGAAEFKRQVATVNDLARAQGAAGGSAEQKRVARQALAEAASKLGKAVLAYARKSGDTSLARQGDQSSSDLLTRRDTDCARVAAQIIEAARTRLPALADYGVNEARVWQAPVFGEFSQTNGSVGATDLVDERWRSLNGVVGGYGESVTRPGFYWRTDVGAFAGRDARRTRRRDTCATLFVASRAVPHPHDCQPGEAGNDEREEEQSSGSHG